MRDSTSDPASPLASQPMPVSPRSRGLILGAIAVVGGIAAIGVWRVQGMAATSSDPSSVVQPVITTVTALGRLAPEGEVIHLAAPTSSQESRIDQLLVQEGDRVTAGQVVAILDSHDRLQAALAQAEEQVRVAEANLAIVQSGAKQGEIDAQRAEIARLQADYQNSLDAQASIVARLQAELQNAEVERDRYDMLYQEGVVSASQRDSKQLTYDTAQRRLQEAIASFDRLQSTSPPTLDRAQATLAQIMDVRPVDIQAAQVQVDQAIAALAQAQASYEQTLVRSPIDAEVLSIHTRPGEVVASDGIIDLGQTQEMKAIAEVYQSDISKVRPGQRVRVLSDALGEELTGTVDWVGSQVLRQTVVNTDPSVNIDARVIEVHIALDAESSDRAAKLTNLQVQVVIEQ